MWLTNLAIKRPIVILMFFTALVVVGLRSRSGMPLDLYPKIDFPFVTITTIYAGAGPEEIETLVSKPLEDAVGSVNGMKNLTSTSQEGISAIGIEFELGTNLDTALADVRSKVDAARMTLPQDAKSPVVQKFDIGSMPVLYLGMSSKRPVKELRQLADDVIKDRLGQLKGVAAVSIVGGDVREIQVNVDKRRLEAYGLSISQVSQALVSANLNLPSGRITEGKRDYSIRAVGEFANVDEIRDLKVKSPVEKSSGTITIGDIGEVKDSVAEREQLTRVQKADSIGIMIMKQSDANTVQVADGVKKELKKMMKDVLPKDVKVGVVLDQSERVKEALADVNVSLWLGALLAVLIVFIFLHSIRGTFIVAIAIPMSIIATFIPIYFLGFTMNMMVMMALSLAVGILVDDSIVVLENIYRHLAKGEEPAVAAFNGRSEIGLAAMAITMVDVVVFLPIAFMGGIVGMFFRAFGITVATATLFSLLVSFTLTPMLASKWYRKGEAVEATSGFFAKFDEFYHLLDRTYRRVLAWALGHRRTVVTSGFGLLIAILFGMGGGALVAMLLATPVKAAVVAFIVSIMILLAFIGSKACFAWMRLHRPTAVVTLLGLLAACALAVMGGHALREAWQPWMSPAFKAVLIGIVVLGVLSFRRIADWSRGHQGLAGAMAFGAMLVIAPNVVPRVQGEFFPRIDNGQVTVTAEMPMGASLEATNSVVRQIEDMGSKIPEVENIFTSVGSTTSGHMGGESGANYGQVVMSLRVKESALDKMIGPFTRGERRRTRSDQQIADEFRTMTAGIPGGRIMVQVTQAMGGGESPINIELTGPDVGELNTVAQQMRSIVASSPGILNADVSWKVGKPEVKAIVDRVRAADMGFSVGQIAQALRTSVAGSTDTHFREGGKEYDIRVRLKEFDRYSLADVGRVVIGSIDGSPVFLQDVAKIVQSSGPTKIERKNRQRKVAVTADLEEGYALQNVQTELQKKIAGVHLGNAAIYWGGQSEHMRESMGDMQGALRLSVALVYMLMAALFESLFSPFIIMFSLPMALIGALLAIVSTGQTMNMVTMIGIIMLMGLVTKNAILLVDYTNTCRARGMERNEAILEAGPTRLRPILMTTFAMIFGMLPTALKLGRGSEMRSPMAIAVIGGLIVSTLLTLVMIPVLYTFFDDLMVKYQRRKQSILDRTAVHKAE